MSPSIGTPDFQKKLQEVLRDPEFAHLIAPDDVSPPTPDVATVPALQAVVVNTDKSWRSLRRCEGKESDWRNSAFASAMQRICLENCPVRIECLREDIASGAPQPGIRAGLSEAQRVRILESANSQSKRFNKLDSIVEQGLQQM